MCPYVRVCMCVCVCVREREREREATLKVHTTILSHVPSRPHHQAVEKRLIPPDGAGGIGALRSTPRYGLHPAPCTLHPAPYTLHPAPCTLHPPPHTSHIFYLGRSPRARRAPPRHVPPLYIYIYIYIYIINIYVLYRYMYIYKYIYIYIYNTYIYISPPSGVSAGATTSPLRSLNPLPGRCFFRPCREANFSLPAETLLDCWALIRVASQGWWDLWWRGARHSRTGIQARFETLDLNHEI